MENAADTNKIIIGPVAVSWNGRLISTQVFVLPSVKVPPHRIGTTSQREFRIPIRVVVSGRAVLFRLPTHSTSCARLRTPENLRDETKIPQTPSSLVKFLKMALLKICSLTAWCARGRRCELGRKRHQAMPRIAITFPHWTATRALTAIKAICPL